ncbi:TonB-dependent receptor [Massilia sp. R2A-15]|uniref:TonB-dependent receptor plug domain-containing protein n=1 Tax=Massilia sp. R2A-15 TaxID=3064278 RepID=UPI0027361DE8|nr:TonB-dependent receptor [Massilia sp. R2A-15]WLI88496.1 TonB-dependent receptor [Massilia sp. R2A-15]
MHKQSLCLRLLLAAPAIFGAFAAHAAGQQDSTIKAPADKPAAPIQKVEIKGAAASYDARRNDTATKIVVSQEDILRNGDTTIGEVLKRLPGVTVGGVQGRGGDIRMRGLGSGYTSILLNGEPAPAGFSLDSLSPDMIERIEIMRAATAEYSTQAIAGAINIVLKRAIVTAQREIKAGFQEEHGHYGTNINYQLADKKGPLSYAIGGAVTYAKFERPSEVVTERYDPAGPLNTLRRADERSSGHFEAFNVSPRVNWTLGPGDVITSQSFININRFTGDNSEHVNTLVGSAPPYSATRVLIKSDSELVRSDLSWTRKLAEGAKLDAKAGVNYNHRDTRAPSFNYNEKDELLIERLITSGVVDKGFTASGKYSTPIFEGHALAAGWDGAYNKRNEDRIQRESSTKVKADNLDQVFEANVRRLALFAQDEWTVTPRWSVYFGLRWEGIETRSEGDGYAAIDNKSSVWSPLFQTLWKIPGSKSDQLRLGLTRTYKAPAVNNLIPRRFASNNNSEISPDFQGNPALRPELAWGLDLAYEHYLEGGGLLTASTYVRRIEDAIHNKTDPVPVNGKYISMPVNDGIANTHGIELEAKLPVRSMWKTAPNIDFRANVSRNWSRLESVAGPNNRIDSQTPFSGTVGADWKLDKLPLTLGSSYSFQNGGPVRIAKYQYAYSVPKRSLDMYGLWKFNPKNQLRVSVANALHQQNVQQSIFDDSEQGRRSETTITPTYVVVRALMEMKF